MTQVHVEAKAWHEIIAIAEFLTKTSKNPSTGITLLEEFDRKCEIYARQPLMGDARDEDVGQGLRSFTFRKWYVAVYQPMSNGIRVLRVFDARSDYTRVFER